MLYHCLRGYSACLAFNPTIPLPLQSLVTTIVTIQTIEMGMTIDFDVSLTVHLSVTLGNEFFLNLCTGRSLTESDDTRCFVNTI
jgi:hypothetical protein